jgi:hypothetical protein
MIGRLCAWSIGILLAGGLLSIALPARAGEGVYKWVDANGQAHFSSLPPAGRKADKLDLRPSTPDPAAPPAARTWQDQVQQASELRQQKQDQEREQARKARAAEQDCLAARRSLELLRRDRPVFRTDAQGERQYIDDDQRQAALQAAQQKADSSCR